MTTIELADQAELNSLVNAIALNDGSLVVFAIAPDSSPLHPVVQAFQGRLGEELGEPVRFSTLHYSDDSVFRFLGRIEGEERTGERQVVMIFGLEQLAVPKLKREMEQLNLGRERIFAQGLVWVFWLNREAFLDEFRRRAADFWDWRGNVVTFVTCPPAEQLLYPYLEWLIAENSYLKMSGVMQVNRQVDIELDQIYVSLQAEWVEERSQSFRERVSPGERVGRSRRNSDLGEPDGFEEEFRDEPLMEMSTEPVSCQRVTKMMDVADAIRQREYGVILGDPGAGKTTLLRYLARHFAIAHREGRSTVKGGMGEDLGGARLPILFRIADFAEKLGVEPELGLVEFLRRFYRQWEDSGSGANDGDSVAEFLLGRMATGDCLLLLDGLDEVLDGENRVRVVRAIDRLVSDYGSNKFVITSRIAGYQEAALGSRFREFTITPMGNEQIQNFLGRWCLAIEVAQRPEAEESLQKRDAEREAAGIFRAIETKPGVKRFAANPLLLTILALIHRNGTQMPQRRVELYELATKTLIEDWQLGRVASYRVESKQLTLVEEEVTDLLAPLAFRMHDEKSSGVVTQTELEEWLVPLMEESQGVEAEVALGLVREFLRKVRETTGLFVERGPGVYGFMHLTFEEYYAARHIADNDVSDILAMIQPYLYEARWNEPILLALGYLSADRKQVNRLLERLFAGLADYQPWIVGEEIRLKNATSDPVLVWRSEPEGGAQESAVVWKDLVFVGQVLAEVKAAPKFCRQQVDKLVLTYVGLDEGFGNEAIQQLLRLFRGIESFNGQVLERLQKSAIDEQLSEEQRDRTVVAILYVVCGEAGDRLVDRVTEIIQDLTPSLFNEIRNLMAELGLEMTPSLERTLEDLNLVSERRRSLEFMTGLSYLRSENYDKAIERLQPLADQADCNLDGFIDWATAIAYEKKEDHEQGVKYYQQCSEKLNSTESLNLWSYWGSCYRSYKKYEESLGCFQQALAIAKKLRKHKLEADLFWNMGRTYQAWKKYEEAVTYHNYSLDIYCFLGKNINIADQWHWIGDCYKDWGKYERAIECEQKCLELRKLEKNTSRIALSLNNLGIIFQRYGKYEESIIRHKESQNLYREIENESNIAWQYFWIGNCYRCLQNHEEAILNHQLSLDINQKLEKDSEIARQSLWMAWNYRDLGEYQQALELGYQNLAIQEKTKNQADICYAHYQLGHIYREWNKYEEAIDYYQKSRCLYHKLEKEKDVADLSYWIGICYRDLGKYEKAIECLQSDLSIRQKLDDKPNIATAYGQLGHIYRAWKKYEKSIDYYQQSRDLYQQLENETSTATQWINIAVCYREQSKYNLAFENIQQGLVIHQENDSQSGIANCYFHIGYIYQNWEKYAEAIDYYQQSLHLYQELDHVKDVATLWAWLKDCYEDWGKYEQAVECCQKYLEMTRLEDNQVRVVDAFDYFGNIYQDWKKYEQAIEYHQKSLEIYQQLDKAENIARQLRRIANSQRKLAKQTDDRPSALTLLNQAEQNLQQAIQLNTENDYQTNLAYDRISLSLLYADRLRHPEAHHPDLIHHFETHYTMGLTTLLDLGQTVSHAEETLDIARAYLEIPALQNLVLAETLAQRSLDTFQEFDRRKLQANAHKLLGEIYNAMNNGEAAVRSFMQSREIYCAIDLPGKVEEIDRLMG